MRRQNKMEAPKKYFVPHGSAALRRNREKQKNYQLNNDLIEAIWNEDYEKAKYYFSENLLKRLQSSIDKGARKGGQEMSDHIFKDW